MPPQHLEGWLWKQGEKGLVKGWKNRWFSLANDFELHYYASNTTMESLGYIDTRIITSVIADPTKKKDAKGFILYINTPSRVYILAANTEKELQYWVDGLNGKLPERRNSVSLSKLQVDNQDKVLMAQLLSEKDTKFEVLSKEAAKQRLKLESCERDVVTKDQRIASLMDQVQNLTSLVAQEKQSTESDAEESAKQNAKLHQLLEQFQTMNEKSATLESTIATLRAQNEAQTQAYARVDADLARARNDAERADAEIKTVRGDVARMEGELARARSDAEHAEAELALTRSNAERLREDHLTLKSESERLNETILHLQSRLKEGVENRDRDSDSHNKRLSLLDKSNADLSVSNGNLEQLLKERGDEVRSWQEKYNANEQRIKELTQTLSETNEKLKERETVITSWEQKWEQNQTQRQNQEGEEKQKYEHDMQVKEDEWGTKWEEMQHFLKEKADQVEEWKERWTKIEENLGDRIREDEDQRIKLESLHRDYDERSAEVEQWKGKWWDNKEKLDEAQKIAREREEEAEKWRARWEELNVEVKGQEESIADMGKEWDGIHKIMQDELDEWKETAKTREEALNAVAVFLEQLCVPVTENGASHEGTDSSQNYFKLSLPNKALRGKYEPLAQRGITIFHMLEESKRIQSENASLKKEIDGKINNGADLDKLSELRKELEETKQSEIDLRQSLREAEENLRQSEESLRDTVHQMKDEIGQLKSDLEAERVANSGNNGNNNGNNSGNNNNDGSVNFANETMLALADAQEDAHVMRTKIEQLLQETQANDASSQVLKDAEDAIAMLYSKVGLLSREMDRLRNNTQPRMSEESVGAVNKRLSDQEEKQRSLEEQLATITKERDELLKKSQVSDAIDLQKRVTELEDELKAKEDDFRIVRQVRQGEMLLKDEELRKKDAELNELRNVLAGGGINYVPPPSALDIPNARFQLQHHNSMSSIEFLQRSPGGRSRDSVGGGMQSKMDELVQELRLKKEEMRKKDEETQAHELEVQELTLRLTEFQMEAKQKELELQAAKEIALYEMEMKVTELEQMLRAKELEVQMKEAELQAMNTVVHTTHEMMRREAGEMVEEAVNRAQDETNQKEEEVQDLYNRLDMAKDVVIQAHQQVADKEAIAEELRQRNEEMEGWLKRKEEELVQIREETQKNIQSLQQEIESLNTQIQDKSCQLQEKSAEIQKKSAEIQEKSAELQDKSAELQDKSAQLEEKSTQLQDKSAEIQDKSLQLQDKSSQIETLTKQIAKMSEELNKSSRAVLEHKTSADVVDLQRKISRLNAEHAFKDDLISNLKRSLEKKGFFGGGNTADMGLVRQLENEKEARLAQQQHITFLCQELDRMEMEAKTKDAKLQTLIERTASLAAPLPELSEEEKNEEVRKLRQELNNLRENYFLSVGRSVKLQGSMVGWYANVSLSELYEEALAQNILISDWPSWITKKFQDANTLKPQEEEK